MKIKLLNESPEKTYAVVLEKGDEVMEQLTAAARKLQLAGARVTGIGAFEKAKLGFFQRDRSEYKEIHINEQVEVLSLLGDIGLANGEPKLHLHVVLGTASAATRGGHLLEAIVWPTLELLVIESPRHLQRKFDPETKLPLIDLEA